MKLIASEPAVDLIREQGGRLYIWVVKGRCCGAPRSLRTAAEAPAGRGAFRAVAADDRFELFLPESLAPLPQELHLELCRFPRRVAAYWNGCAWVV